MLPYQIIDLEGLLGKLFEGSQLSEVGVLRKPFIIRIASECCSYSYTSYNA
jgi:hypothetical protein